MDYFGARYFSSAQGRFTSVDRLLLSARPETPQSWNRYAYTVNNPLRYIDPTGLIWGELGGQLIWYKDEGALKEAGATVYTQSSYTTTTGRHVLLNPDGPHPNADPSNATLSGLYDRQGWVYDEPNTSTDYGTQFAIGGAIKAGVTGGVSLLGWIFGAGASEATEGGAGEIIAGLSGTVTRGTLESLASEGGPSVQVFTKLTQAPEVGRELSVWVGEADATLANSVRSVGQVYSANIPTGLLTKLEGVGLAVANKTMMKGSTALGTEIKFSAKASEFVVRFFGK